MLAISRICYVHNNSYDPARKKAPDFAKGDGLLRTLWGLSMFGVSFLALFEGRLASLPFVPSIGLRLAAESSFMEYSWAASVTQEVDAIRMKLLLYRFDAVIYGNYAVAKRMPL